MNKYISLSEAVLNVNFVSKLVVELVYGKFEIVAYIGNAVDSSQKWTIKRFSNKEDAVKCLKTIKDFLADNSATALDLE